MSAAKDDPRRLIRLASRPLRLLGIISLILSGLVFLIIVMLSVALASIGPVPGGPSPSILFLVTLLTWGTVMAAFIAAGCALLRCGKRVSEGRRGWAISGLVVSILLACVSALGLFAVVFLMSMIDVSYPNIIKSIALVCLLLAFVLLTWHLRVSLGVLHLVGGRHSRGHGRQISPISTPPANTPPMVMPPRPRL